MKFLILLFFFGFILTALYVIGALIVHRKEVRKDRDTKLKYDKEVDRILEVDENDWGNRLMENRLRSL